MRMARSPFTITPFFPTSSRQFGRGGITVFRGSPIPHVQYGRGFGSLFKSMGRMVTPLIGKAVRYAGKTGLETGIGLLSDVLSGENVKTAAKRRASEAFQQTKQDALEAVKRRRQGPSTTTTTSTVKRKRKKGRKQKGGRPTDDARPQIFLDKTTSRRTGDSFPYTLRSCEDRLLLLQSWN